MGAPIASVSSTIQGMACASIKDRAKRWDKSLVCDEEYMQLCNECASAQEYSLPGARRVGAGDSDDAYVVFTGMGVDPLAYRPLALHIHKRFLGIGISVAVYILDY